MKQITRNQGKTFRRLSFITVISVYLLILVGGIVRSTGSGMGCPDWPKCFGSWIPPGDITQLPANYQEVYAQKRAEKNERFSAYLEVMGFTQLAYQIRNDHTILDEAEFNKYKTWIEYFNRLVGVAIGILIFSTFIASISYLKKDKAIFFISLASLLLVIFQGWIGSVVVSTNLLPWMITVHMMLALLLVALLIYASYRSYRFQLDIRSFKQRKVILWVLSLCLFTMLVQITLGTQVREGIDKIAASMNYLMRDQWIANLGTTFYLHRSLSILIIILHVYLVYLLFKNSMKSGKVLNLSKILILLVVLEVGSGIIMAYFAIPAFFQPVHLLLASLIFGVQFFLLLLIGHSGKSINKKL